jgi:hypothetical protein
MKTRLGLLLLLVIPALPAWAVLGEYEGSVSLDQQVLRAEIREVARTGYKVHQMITPEGAVIREFVSPEGKVFGIAWQSRTLPNLQQLLGSYFPRIEQAAQAHVQHRAPLLINTPDLVYFSGGRMMNFYGSAYVPGLLPKNVSAGVVR